MLCTTSLTLALLTMVSSAPFVLSRPAPFYRPDVLHRPRDKVGDDTIDPRIILSNALEAQTLNAEFGNMTISDSCTNGDVACIGGALAFCADDAWETQDCPSALSCLAAPSLADTGVIVSCTTQADVDSLIASAGATGDDNSSCEDVGDAGDVNNSTSNNATCTETGSKGPIVLPTGGAGNSGVVTVTVTLNPTAPTTLPPVTSTIDPNQASSLLSSLNANPSVSISTISAPGATTTSPTGASVDGALAGGATTISLTPQAATGAPSSTPTPAPTNGPGVVGALGQGADAQAPAPTTILLTPQAASPSSTASQASSTPAAAAANAPPAAPPPAAAAPGGY